MATNGSGTKTHAAGASSSSSVAAARRPGRGRDGVAVLEAGLAGVGDLAGDGVDPHR